MAPVPPPSPRPLPPAVKPTRAIPGTVVVGVGQIFCLDGDRSGNLVRIENAVAEAKRQGAEIVTLPESALLGWENPAAHVRADPIPGSDSDRLCALARAYRVHLCVGLDEKEGDRLYGSCLLIDDRGKILLKHRKVNVLAELMTPPYSPGAGVAAVDTRLGRIGVIICADSFVPDVLQAMRAEAPDLLLIPYGWAAPEAKWPRHGQSLRRIVQKVARTVGCPVVGTDLVGMMTHGPWAGQVYGGQSVVADGRGRILRACADRDREVAVLRVRRR